MSTQGLLYAVVGMKFTQCKDGLGYYNELKYHQLFYVVGAVWIFQIIFSAIWLRYYLFGPFEWLWRSATYWKKQPFKKS